MINKHRHFVQKMCFLVFLEPSRCSPRAGVSWFLQPSRHLSRSCASNLCKPLAIMTHTSTYFLFFFGLPFLSDQLLSAVPLLGVVLHPFPISIRPNHCNLCALRKSSSLSISIISRIFSLFILSIKVFLRFICSILISVVSGPVPEQRDWGWGGQKKYLGLGHR